MDIHKYAADLEARLKARLSQTAQPSPPIAHQLEQQINAIEASHSRLERSPSSSSSLLFRSLLVDMAERAYASGAAGISLSQFAQSFGVPRRLLNQRAWRRQLRTLAGWLSERGIDTVPVNERYFAAPHRRYEVKSIAAARKFLPVFQSLAGLHFIREQNDWYWLGDVQHYLLVGRGLIANGLRRMTALHAAGLVSDDIRVHIAESTAKLAEIDDKLDLVNRLSEVWTNDDPARGEAA